MKSYLRSVRVDTERAAKWDAIAKALDVAPNRVVSILLDNAQVVSEPRINVTVNKNNHHTTNFAGTGEAVVQCN